MPAKTGSHPVPSREEKPSTPAPSIAYGVGWPHRAMNVSQSLAGISEVSASLRALLGSKIQLSVRLRKAQELLQESHGLDLDASRAMRTCCPLQDHVSRLECWCPKKGEDCIIWLSEYSRIGQEHLSLDPSQSWERTQLSWFPVSLL